MVHRTASTHPVSKIEMQKENKKAKRKSEKTKKAKKRKTGFSCKLCENQIINK
jgi:hypothetical protein